ncbi:MAG: DUF4432 family protein [Acidobacteria bacterium]|nr:DUF4432 family protein [Acidobacteriota bacterium]
MTSLLSLALAVALAQTPRLLEEQLHGRNAWVLDNGVIRVAALRGGGHIGEVRLLSKDPGKSVNPMRVPHYPTIDPQRYVPSQHDAIYGSGSHRWLSAGYMGHLLCFPFYGPPSSEDEIKAELGNHGEAPIVEWRKIKVDERAESVTFWYAADLNKTHYRVERAITMAAGARHFKVEEWVENLTAYDRPFQWMQHATFGPPFVEPGKTFLDASAAKGLTAVRPGGGSLASNSYLQWPNGLNPEGKAVDLRVFQPKPNAGTYYVMLTNPDRRLQFFTLYHADYRVLIGYVFPGEQNPWLADWQENKSNTTPPWNGKAVARGLEFGNSPFAEGLRKAVQRGSLFDVPAYGWIGARQKLKNEFTVFLEEIPAGYRGVRDVHLVNGSPRVFAR